MVSAIRYRSFKDMPWTRRQPSLTIVLIAFLVWSIVVYSDIVLILLAGVYTISGVVLHLVRVAAASPRPAGAAADSVNPTSS